jgi:hypothetical protein
MTRTRRIDTTVTIASRFHGPEGSGNGGYSCGLAAGFVGDHAQVTLHAPPPLERPLAVRDHDGGVQLWDEDTLVADASPWPQAIDAPPAVDLDAAVRVATDPEQIPWHPFPSCFVCGPQRAPGDGLRIFPGLVSEGLLAAPWTPGEDLAAGDGSVGAEYLWAALDCPTGWATMLLVPPGTVSVLGRLTGVIHGLPALGTACVVVSRPDGRDGRKAHASAGLYTADGHLLAAAAATWITIR